MATIVTEGIIRDVKELDNGLTAFSLCENSGNKENPNYIYYDCQAQASENQKQYLTDNRILKVVGRFNSKRTVKDQKTYTNLSIYIYNFEFGGMVNTEPKVSDQ